MGDHELITELEQVVAERERLLRRRDLLVRELMRLRVPRERIAAAAGLRVARLYQIKDDAQG